MPLPVVADERRSRLLELVRARGFASLPSLAEELGVSDSTIRRDLDALEETGSIQRTHGGVFYTGPSPKLTHFDLRESAHYEKKRRIAEMASALVQDGETILIDGGSTAYELARLLVGRPIQVVTNSLPVATLFTSSDSGDLVLIGGYVHTRTGVSLGPYANEMLGRVRCRRAFLSVAGVQSEGFYNSNLLLVETERVMMQSADEVVVLADSTKFGHSSLAHLCGLDAVDKVIVDDELSDSWRRELDRAGVESLFARATAAAKPSVA